jgi:hypothetical protein
VRKRPESVERNGSRVGTRTDSRSPACEHGLARLGHVQVRREGSLRAESLVADRSKAGFWFGPNEAGLARSFPTMSLRADLYRQKAAEAKHSAARASNPSVKAAFQEVARGWLVLAEQMEWIDSQKLSLPDGERIASITKIDNTAFDC